MNKKINHYRRYKGYDYRRGASLFISIATQPRMACFGMVKDAKVVLSAFGELVLNALEAIPCYNPHITLFGHVLMPDHVHMRVYLPSGLDEPLKILGDGIRRFKSYTTYLARQMMHIPSLWQQGYHDILCLNRRFIESVERYIAYNPLKYELLHNQSQVYHIIEPLMSERLDPADYWKGLGNPSLLSANNPIASVRVSRKVMSFQNILNHISQLTLEGFTILSGFISPGELAVREMLVSLPRANFIHMLPGSMSCQYKPYSLLLPPLHEGRLLEIARGNAPEELNRGDCLELNQEMVNIAKAGMGMCLYYR